MSSKQLALAKQKLSVYYKMGTMLCVMILNKEGRQFFGLVGYFAVSVYQWHFQTSKHFKLWM